MGRWDALKPDTETKGNAFTQNQRPQQRHHHRPTTTSHSSSVPKKTSLNSKWRSSRGGDGYALDQTQASFTERLGLSENPQTQYERLVLECSKEAESLCEKTEKISELSGLILKDRCFSGISSPNLFEDAVDGVFLPFLECFLVSVEQDVRISVSGTDHNYQTALLVTSALERLLDSSVGQQKGSPYISKLLAPLVVEVSDSGREIQRPNHIRLRLLTILQDLLQKSSRLITLRQRVATCLLQALKAARAIEGTTKHALGSKLDVDPSLFHRFFVETTEQNTALLGLSLELLVVLVERHPETSSQFMTYLLVQHRYNHSQLCFSIQSHDQVVSPFTGFLCDYCNLLQNVDINVPFLYVLHGSPRSAGKLRAIAANLMVQILDHLPPSVLEQWLRGALAGTRSLGDSIKTGIQNLMDSCCCCLRSATNNTNASSLELMAGTILRRIPFAAVHSTSSEAFVQTATSLSEALFERFLELSSSQHRGDVTLNLPFIPLPQQFSVGVLILAIGGSETPQGFFLQMTVPVRHFLDSPKGNIVIRKLLDRAWSGENESRVLRAIVRTHPRLFLRNRELWGMFVGLVFGGTDSMAQGRQMETLVALLEGRRDFLGVENGVCLELFVTPTRVVDEILPQLHANLTPKTSAAAKIAALSAYGSLVSEDWGVLISRGTAKDHWEALVSACQNNASNLKVKKVAFKTLGDFSTNYFSFASTGLPISSNSNRLLCNAAYQAILVELEQQRESTSTSMALYAFGNLVRVLNEFKSELLDPSSLERFAEVLIKICNPSSGGHPLDAKMQTNAIRALGHLVCLLYSLSGAEDSNRCAILSQGLDALASSIRRTLYLARKESTINLSWKERSAVKKIGWGSCHALALVLPLVYGSDKLDERSQESSRQCILTLIDCVLNLNYLHEKVGLVSMSTLCSLDLSYSRLTPSFNHDKQIALGPIIVRCLEFISLPRDDGTARDAMVLSAKSLFQIESLVLHLLSCCSVLDAENVLSSSSSGDQHEKLSFLHSWLLLQKQRKDASEECVAASVQRAFDTFALAMQKRPDLLSTVDIRLEQQFVSEARPAMMDEDKEEDEL